MRIDPKYFNRFMLGVAIVSVLIIAYSTFRYFQKQIDDFEQNIIELNSDSLAFASYMEPDTLRVEMFENRPIIVHFWATWSERSIDVNQILQEYQSNNPKIVVILAAVRDSDLEIKKYMTNRSSSFYFVDGTKLFQQMMAPGLPTQLFFDSSGNLAGYHVGDDADEIQKLLNEFSNE